MMYKKPTQRAPEVHKVPGRVQGLPARVGNRGSCHQFHIYFDDNDDDDDVPLTCMSSSF